MADLTQIDPLGRRITLFDDAWFGHIIKGHPDVKAYRQVVELTLSRPEQICFSTSDPDCRIYYGPGRGKLMIAVVVDVVRGFVKTAYFTRKPKGTIEWSR